jgi:TonB-linked SusC/RagA family outer membrane protein
MGANDNQRHNNSWYNGESALFGIFGRADYTYDNKYLFTGIVRRDGVSRFAEKNRYGVFPSASVGWRVSEEDFMEDSREWLDDLKLRVGYGNAGNAEIPRTTNFAMLFGTAPDRTNYDLGGSNTGSDVGYRLTDYGNEETRWEATKMTNIGVDITFGGNRFNSTLEYYNKVTTDMLVTAAYSSLASDEVGRPYINYGDMRNRGFDFSFNYRDKAGDLGWDLGLNLSTYKNKVLGLSTADDYALWGNGFRLSTSVTRTIKGRPISEFFGYNVIGFYEDEQDVLNSPIPYGTTADVIEDNPGSYVGKFKFEDFSGPEGVPDGVINSFDRKVIGNPHPDLVAGLNATLQYRNFDFTMFWYSTIGNDLFNNNKYFTDFPLFGGNRSTRYKEQSWKKGADNSNAILPILDSKDNWGGAVASSYYVEDGSFLKLKNLVVGYTFPKHILEKATISNLRLYLQAENILTLTNYSGLDPEITNMETASGSGSDLRRGLDGGGWPTTMRFVFGVNFEF